MLYKPCLLWISTINGPKSYSSANPNLQLAWVRLLGLGKMNSVTDRGLLALRDVPSVHAEERLPIPKIVKKCVNQKPLSYFP